MAAETPPNEPLLADVRAPWDRSDEQGPLDALKSAWETLAYMRRYGFYWAPASMDGWKYRRFLRDLDAICLRALDSHGALSAAELTDWLNREKLVRTKPDLTGIQAIAIATTHDWLALAGRRGLVAPYADARADRPGSGRRHWVLTERGSEEVRSRMLTLLARVPVGPIATGIGTLIFGGGLIAAFKWLSLHESILITILLLLGYGAYFGFVYLYFSRFRKKEGPGLAVVAIETVRSAGESIPVLGAR